MAKVQKPKPKPKPVYDSPDQPDPVDLASDPLFISHIRQSAITAALADSSVNGDRATELIDDLDSEAILQVIEHCGITPDADPEPPADEDRPSDEDRRSDETQGSVGENRPVVAAAVGVHTQAAGFFSTVIGLILGMDPAVRQRIVDAILKLVGLKV